MPSGLVKPIVPATASRKLIWPVMTFSHVGELESSKSAMKTFAPELSALMIIFRSTGPVISTRRFCRSRGMGATPQSLSRISRVSGRKLGIAPSSSSACRWRRRTQQRLPAVLKLRRQAPDEHQRLGRKDFRKLRADVAEHLDVFRLQQRRGCFHKSRSSGHLWLLLHEGPMRKRGFLKTAPYAAPLRFGISSIAWPHEDGRPGGRFAWPQCLQRIVQMQSSGHVIGPYARVAQFPRNQAEKTILSDIPTGAPEKMSQLHKTRADASCRAMPGISTL